MRRGRLARRRTHVVVSVSLLEVRSERFRPRGERPGAASVAVVAVDGDGRQAGRGEAVYVACGVRIAVSKPPPLRTQRTLRYSMKNGITTVIVFVVAHAVIAQQPQPPRPAILQNYSALSMDQLKAPPDGDWPMVRRTYDGWGFSPLQEITPANVARLQPVWSMATGMTSGHQAPPVVRGGVMFVATPGNQVISADAGTGAVLWRYRRQTPGEAGGVPPTSRGGALAGGKGFFPPAEAALVAP